MQLETPETTAISAVWDGRDALGNVLPDGTHFYRLVVRAWRVHQDGGREFLDRSVTGVQEIVIGPRADRIPGFDGAEDRGKLSLEEVNAMEQAVAAERAAARDPIARIEAAKAVATTAAYVQAQNALRATRSIQLGRGAAGVATVRFERVTLAPLETLSGQPLTGPVEVEFVVSPHAVAFEVGRKYLVLLARNAGTTNLVLPLAENPDGDFSVGVDRLGPVPRAQAFELLGGQP